MKKIKLTQGKYALVDKENFEYLNQLKWCFDGRYAQSFQNGSKVRMHRIISNAPSGLEVDHINGNGLDNRKLNIRLCLHKDNGRNLKLQRRNKSGQKGVEKVKNKWRSSIVVDYRKNHIGYFYTKQEAALAYNNSALKNYGRFARLNII